MAQPDSSRSTANDKGKSRANPAEPIGFNDEGYEISNSVLANMFEKTP
jgi:hypothetical protein